MREVQTESHGQEVFAFDGVRNEETSKMPVDFTSYLLSASPPGFDMYHHFSGAPGEFLSLILHVLIKYRIEFNSMVTVTEQRIHT